MPTLARPGGVRGTGGVLAIPGRRFGAPFSSQRPSVASKPFRSPPFSTALTRITGVTRDSTGAALGFCTVDLFSTPQDVFVATTTSDASGNYTFNNPGSGPFYIVAYFAGAPDVAGTTVNTLVAA